MAIDLLIESITWPISGIYDFTMPWRVVRLVFFLAEPDALYTLLASLDILAARRPPALFSCLLLAH
jgi:hypothetical protein